MSVLTVALVGYLAWAALLFFAQRSMLFPGTALAGPPAGQAGLPEGVERFWFEFGGGRAEAWWVGTDATPPAPAIVFAHGNAELIDHNLADARSLAGLGASVLLVEYPGYGRSDGSPSRASIAEVFTAAYDWLSVRPDVDSGRIVGFGRSLGSGAVGDLSGVRPIRALVLVSPLESVARFARRYLVPPVLVRDRFDNAAALAAFDGPVLLFHGRRDRVIPHVHSERLVEASPRAELVSLECGHNDCPPDRAAYLRTIRAFLVRSAVLPAEEPRQ